MRTIRFNRPNSFFDRASYSCRWQQQPLNFPFHSHVEFLRESIRLNIVMMEPALFFFPFKNGCRKQNSLLRYLLSQSFEILFFGYLHFTESGLYRTDITDNGASSLISYGCYLKVLTSDGWMGVKPVLSDCLVQSKNLTSLV
jgi:hypothetical protein